MCNYLCFDLGTTKIKSALINSEGKIIYISSLEAKTYFDDGVYQKPEEYYKKVVNEIQNIKKLHEAEFQKAEYLICSGQMGGVLGIGNNWKVLFPWSYSLDNRFNPYLEMIEKIR